MSKLTALDALKLAKETGCKVRPAFIRSGYSKFIGSDLYNFTNKAAMLGGENTVHWGAIINDDGTPVEWEVVE